LPDQPALRRARERAEVLRRLHTEPGLLVLVNVWDVASARAVAAVPGCQAVATASAAIAAAHGYPDGERIPVDLMLAAVGRIAAAVDLPTTADLESGYGDVATTIRRAVQLGVAGANLEDALRPLPAAVRMVEQAVRSAAAEGVPLVLNARTDRYLHPQGQPPAALLDETLQRGHAFLNAGADCVFVPGCTDPAAIATLADRFGPGRLSLLAVPGLPPPEQLLRLGVARLSHGPAPHQHALAALTDLAAGLQATTPHT
jgi:2-methylisocitrate lyase-like PEP mutase family enzyme